MIFIGTYKNKLSLQGQSRWGLEAHRGSVFGVLRRDDEAKHHLDPECTFRPDLARTSGAPGGAPADVGPGGDGDGYYRERRRHGLWSVHLTAEAMAEGLAAVGGHGKGGRAAAGTAAAGKEARQARSARIRAALSGNEPLEANK